MDVFKGRKDLRVEFEMKESTKALGRERGEIYCQKLHDMALRTLEPGTYGADTNTSDSPMRLLREATGR